MSQQVTDSQKIKALQLLVRSEEMELYLHKRFPTVKRYSGEGSEALIVALNALLASTDADHCVLGMPHRGRLATLVVLNDYPMRNLLHKLTGKNEMPAELLDGLDDIPTHIAVSNTKQYSLDAAKGGRKVTLTTLHNPSHLET